MFSNKARISRMSRLECTERIRSDIIKHDKGVLDLNDEYIISMNSLCTELLNAITYDIMHYIGNLDVMKKSLYNERYKNKKEAKNKKQDIQNNYDILLVSLV